MCSAGARECVNKCVMCYKTCRVARNRTRRVYYVFEYIMYNVCVCVCVYWIMGERCSIVDPRRGRDFPNVFYT